MIKELSEFGKRLRSKKSQDKWMHDAFNEETISLVLTIKADGSFVSLQSIENKKTQAEGLQRTSDKEARLLLDNCGYVLGVYDSEGNKFKNKSKEKGEIATHELFKKDASEKLDLFIKRLQVVDLEEIKPILNFYIGNKQLGIDVVNQEYFMKNILKKDRGGNIAILVSGKNKYMHEYDSVSNKIIADYDAKQQILLSNNKRRCAICGNEQFPVGDFTHYPIKKVPGDKEPAGGRKLISYNGDNNPFESYEMIGNENSSVCTNCAKTYVEGLNWLLSNGNTIKTIDKKGKEKQRFQYSNRKDFGSDTAMVFWTRDDIDVSEMSLLDAPDPQVVANLIDSVAKGNKKSSKHLDADQFYSCTLSGSAARIAVRDWIETSLTNFRANIAKWFRDIGINSFNQTYYPSLYKLAYSCQDVSEKKEIIFSRIGGYLWNCALKNNPPPIWILTCVLKRAKLDKKGVTPERAALIKLILNRNIGGSFMVQESLSQDDRPVAYVCGQIFAKLESIQYAAHGELNSGIREKYFTYFMTLPSAAIGRLFNLNSKHFTKLKGDKPGLAITLDKELQNLCRDINIEKLPQTFSLEEQGQFAIGYYHQKQSQFNNLKQ